MTKAIYHLEVLRNWTTLTSQDMFQCDASLSRLHLSTHPFFGRYSDILNKALEDTKAAFLARQYSSLHSARQSLYTIGVEHSISEDPGYFALIEANQYSVHAVESG